jgi:hypothetical protein
LRRRPHPPCCALGYAPPKPFDANEVYPKLTAKLRANHEAQEAKAGEDDGGPRVINTAEAYDNHRVAAKWVTYADDDGDDVDDELAELAPRWVEKHVVTYLEGPGGLGKSMIALQDAVCLASGHDILGVPVEQAGVLYLNYEEKARSSSAAAIGSSDTSGLPRAATFRRCT